MATKHKPVDEHQDPEVAIESAIDKTESFLYEHGKKLLIIVAVIVVAISGYIGYKHIYLANRAEKAGAMIFVAEQNFMSDAYEVALNGDGNNPGFLDVISKYGRTPQGNIAKHYAGICYMHLGDYDNALKCLSGYKAVSGIPSQIINAQNLGLIGDVYVQKGDYAKAVVNFEKAVKISDNELTAPYMLKKLGLVYVRLGRNAEAVKVFQRIKDEFSTSMEARDIDKFIGQAEQK